MVAVRKHRKMSLLTELEILGAGFLQRWRAYGAANYFWFGFVSAFIC